MPRNTNTESAFIEAVKRMESATSRVRAVVVINPAIPDRNGRIIITYPHDGAGVVRAVAWLPGDPSDAESYYVRHHGKASGYGYDKATAAMGGARVWNLKTGAYISLQDSGFDWDSQLREAGYIVVNAV
jgi:hypothetical protein